MILGSVWLSFGVLVASVLMLAYALFTFAHVRIQNSDMAELARLRSEGILPAEARLVEDFQLIHAKVAQIAPAVYLRQEFWIQIYFQILRLAQWMEWRKHSGFVERELLNLSAFQAHHYRTALTRMAALQHPYL